MIIPLKGVQDSTGKEYRLLERKPMQAKRTREEILQLLSELKKSSGLTIKAFCQLKGISEGLYYSYQSRYRPGRQRSCNR